MKTSRILLFIGLFLAAACTSSGGGKGTDFSVPAGFLSDPDLVPASWIEKFQVDPATELAPEQVNQLEALFIAAYDASMQKYQQDYLIPASADLYQLLKRHHPALETLEAEGGRVSLRAIAGMVR